MIFRLALLVLLSAVSASAQGFNFLGSARLQSGIDLGFDARRVVTGRWVDGSVETVFVEGHKTQQAWRLPTPTLTPAQLLRPLREQLRNDGYRVVFECQSEACGGFDFRFSLDVIAPPYMLISLGDFAYLVARQGAGAQAEFVTLIASRTAQAGYVQVDQIGPQGHDPQMSFGDALRQELVEDMSFAQELDTFGRVVLADLRFETGSAQLGAGPFASLSALATVLAENPTLQIALVGHTDASGAFSGNVTLSQRRAASVLERLASEYGVARGQMRAEGVGYLAPVASNATAKGRQANRRVEAVIISTGN